MKVILIDDEPLARLVVAEYLQVFPQLTIVAECNDGFEGVKAIQQHKPDVIFLDIQMPKINGFEMLELLENPPSVIFTTAFDEYAIKAFEAHAIDYLLKPFSQERFSTAVNKLLGQLSGRKTTESENVNQLPLALPVQAERIVVKIGGKIKIIGVHQIQYLEAADDYVKIHTADGVFLKNKTMAFYDRSLPEATFVRIHRSYLVNVNEITRIEPYEKESHLAILRSGEQLSLSKAGYTRLKAILGL